jgi:hypothetical protein
VEDFRDEVFATTVTCVNMKVLCVGFTPTEAVDAGALSSHGEL